MLRKTLLIYIISVALLALLSISCNLTGDDCGPFKDKFKVVNFDVELENVSISSSLGELQIAHSALQTDTVKVAEFGISLFPVSEYYSLNTSPRRSFSFFSKAYACSPPIPVSEEIITNIKISSNRDYNSNFSAGDDLSELFDVMVFYRGEGYEAYSLNEFISSNPSVPDELFLIPSSTPETTQPITFTIQYYQDGIDLDYFESTTKPVVITP
ncbi:MAG: hypothetical protein CL670_01695 [Balneola sp.]|jgi:hypothetical protein|nr:hypothetical protein [Balneola sp.]MBE77848.1 hypothetical protein [Balneola sp.]|tara:strand:+ start:428 stop:1066 length:639 start_codon:yes stop_codon:yes gene_type:complete